MARLFSTRSRQRVSFASMPMTHFSVNAFDPVGGKFDCLQQFERNNWHCHIQFEIPRLAAERNGRVAADHMSRDLNNRFAENRIDFTWHDRRTGLRVRQADLANSAARPEASQRISLAILIRLTTKVLSTPLIWTEASRAACASK
jgi:hypothetical protein